MAEPPSRQSTLVERAAKYFGYYDKPRRSIRLNNAECVIVAEHGGGKTLLMYYGEEFGPTGTVMYLTSRARDELVEALQEVTRAAV